MRGPSGFMSRGQRIKELEAQLSESTEPARGGEGKTLEAVVADMRLLIEGLYADHSKYPQLRLPEMQVKRVERLMNLASGLSARVQALEQVEDKWNEVQVQRADEAVKRVKALEQERDDFHHAYRLDCDRISKAALVRAEDAEAKWIETSQLVVEERKRAEAAEARVQALRRACGCSEPDPVQQADRKFYCQGCSFETGARPSQLIEVVLLGRIAELEREVVHHREVNLALLNEKTIAWEIEHERALKAEARHASAEREIATWEREVARLKEPQPKPNNAEEQMGKCRYCSKWGPCPEHDTRYQR